MKKFLDSLNLLIILIVGATLIALSLPMSLACLAYKSARKALTD